MKKYRTNEYSLDTRVCGFFNQSPLAITRTNIKNVLESEKLHSHNNSHEYYMFLKGKAKVIVGEKIITVSDGDVILAEPNEKHKILEVIEPIEYITIKTNNDPLDKVIHEESDLETFKETVQETRKTRKLVYNKLTSN